MNQAGEASVAAKELLNEVERVKTRMAGTLGWATAEETTPTDPDVINKKIVKALIEGALIASEKGDDRKAVHFLQFAMKAMT